MDYSEFSKTGNNSSKLIKAYVNVQNWVIQKGIMHNKNSIFKKIGVLS